MSRQVLSAAVDNAATAAEWDELLDAMEHDPALKAEWSRAWAHRDIRSGMQAKATDAFCAGVMAAIAAEPQTGAKVVSLAGRRSRLPRPALKWQTLVPLSAAAGVVAAVLFVGDVRAPETEPATMALAAAAVESNVALTDEAKAAILNAYLIEHSNSLAERGMGSTLVNARFAARSANYRPDSP